MKLNRRRKVMLLAASYLDAIVMVRDDFRSKPGHKHLIRESELWRLGSYAELETAMNRLRQDNRKRYRWFWALYVVCDRPKDLHAHKMAAAAQGLSFVVEGMPENIYVPEDVCIAAGFVAEVAAARRPRARAA